MRTLVLGLDANALSVGAPAGVLRNLQEVQNRAVRVIHHLPGDVHITPVLRELCWLPIWQRIRHKLLTLTYIALTSVEAPVYLARVLERRATRQLRSSEYPLAVPKTREFAGDRASDVAVPSLRTALSDS